MKKKCITLALLMAISQAMPTFAADSAWLKGWTGKEGSTDYSISENGSSFVLSNNKVNNGKFTDGEDSIIYCAQKISGDEDFTFSATVSIDEYNVMEESSNPQQGSVGIAVLDDLFNKTDDIAYTDSLFLGAYAADKKSDPAICPMIRDNSSAKLIGDTLSDSFSAEGTDIGSFDLSITKSGNIYTFTCGEKSWSSEVYSFEEDIYPCLYIARNAKATFSNVKLDIAKRHAVGVTVKDAQTEYFYGEEIKPITAVVEYSDGSSEETQELSVKGYRPDHVGKQKVVISAGAAKTTLDVNVKALTVQKLELTYSPVKTSYAVNSPFISRGLEVTATYSDGSTAVLDEDQYTIELNGKKLENGDILTTAGTSTANITRKNETGINGGNASAHFRLSVSPKTVAALELTPPVKTKYYKGDKLDISGIKVIAKYSDGTSERLENNEFTVTGADLNTVGSGKVTVTPVCGGASASYDINVIERTPQKLNIVKYPRTVYNIGDEPDTDLTAEILYDNGDSEKTEAYTVDTSAVDTSVPGEYSVSVIPTDTTLSPVSIKVSVGEEKTHYWRKTVFGQSSGYDKQESGSTGVTAENYGTVEGKINVRSWDGSGKITNDHDGISYYYTQTDPDEDFFISADITVNKYLEHDNSDEKRNGQEAFGIMVRDVIPLIAADGGQTTDPELAQKDENGVAVPEEGSKVFASNMALFGGYSGTGWPSDASDPQYEKKTKLNRINLLVREGVEAPDGGGTRIGPDALSETFPAEGNRYNLTMQRVNGGLYVKCLDYQTGESKDEFYYDESFLNTQSKQAYIGFFTARWADIDVENVEFYTGSKQFSQTITAQTDESKTAEISVDSGNYSTDTNYALALSPSGANGRATVMLNDTVIAKDIDVKGTTELNTTLKADSENRFTVVFTPDDTEKLTSYDPIVIRHIVYQKTLDKSLSTLYVSPGGSFDGSGTEDSPLDLDSAAGLLGAGQTIVMAEGTYYRTKPLEITKGNSGTSSAYKTLKADGKVVLDYRSEYAGAVISGDYWHIDGLEFTNCGPNLKCVHLGGSHNIIENCKFHDNRDMGLQISRTDGNDDKSTWPSDNLILNCESYNNCDPSGINADGFGAKLTVGTGNIFRGCSSHHNVDDGWDLYTKISTGAIGAVTLENCVSYKNGIHLNEDGSETSYDMGGNNGFKLGGENVAVAHKLINCEAYGNLHNGVTTNSNPTLIMENVKCHDNKAANFRLYSDKPDEYAYTATGIVSYNGGEPDVLGTVNTDTDHINHSETPLLNSTNQFDLGK